MKVKALERIENRLKWIDQTALPGQLVHKESDDYKEIVSAIKRLEIRGAPAIGIAAAYGIAVGVQKAERSDADLVRKIGEEFKQARPTAVNLFWAVDRMVARYTDAGVHENIGATKLLWDEAEAIHSEDIEMCRKIGENGAQLIQDGDSILTHCNTGALATGGIGTAAGVIYTCKHQGKTNRVYADETRPLLQGARLTAWELMQEGIDVTLICDNTAGMLMRQGKVKHVIVGADRITRNGDVANKIGTYSVAALAREHNIPFYVAAPSSSIDWTLTEWQDIPIEERPGVEVARVRGRTDGGRIETVTVIPTGSQVANPAFDVTPAELVTGIITERGVAEASREALARLFPEKATSQEAEKSR